MSSVIMIITFSSTFRVSPRSSLESRYRYVHSRLPFAGYSDEVPAHVTKFPRNPYSSFWLSTRSRVFPLKRFCAAMNLLAQVGQGASQKTYIRQDLPSNSETTARVRAQHRYISTRHPSPRPTSTGMKSVRRGIEPSWASWGVVASKRNIDGEHEDGCPPPP